MLRFFGGHAVGDERAGGIEEAVVGGISPEGEGMFGLQRVDIDGRASLTLPSADRAEVVGMSVGEDDGGDCGGVDTCAVECGMESGAGLGRAERTIHEEPAVGGCGATQKIDVGGVGAEGQRDRDAPDAGLDLVWLGRLEVKVGKLDRERVLHGGILREGRRLVGRTGRCARGLYPTPTMPTSR